jgi:hypothetical protein
MQNVMNWQDIKNIIKEELKEATTVSAGNTKFNLRTGVNKNPTKLGIKIQFEPKAGGLESDTKSKLEVALQEKLNDTLKEYDIQVSKDTDVPREDVIGFFIPLSQLKNLIVKSLTGSAPVAEVQAPEPEGKKMNEGILNEMRVRDLNEISKVVVKEDFYAFINAGNNVIRTLEENGKSVREAKKYLAYLVKHNIM